jgi:hypothetical protein
MLQVYTTLNHLYTQSKSLFSTEVQEKGFHAHNADTYQRVYNYAYSILAASKIAKTTNNKGIHLNTWNNIVKNLQDFWIKSWGREKFP